MATTTPAGAGIIKYVLFTLVLIIVGVGGCLLVLPFYQSIEARMLLGEAIKASADGQSIRAIKELDEVIVLDPKSYQAYVNRGLVYTQTEDYDKAAEDFQKALQISPRNEQLLFDCGYAYEKTDDYKNALAIYHQAVTFHPESSMAYNNLAWLLATCPQAEFRDGKKAVDYATKACDLSQWKDPASLDTLASAYAEVGDFDHALQWENVALSCPNFNPTDAAEARDRLVLYQSHKPYHREQ